MSEYDSRADVYFREEDCEPQAYFASFDPEVVPLALYEGVEMQLGKEYERLVDAGEKVYVGQVKFNSNVDFEDYNNDNWTFNRVPPKYVNAEQDGLTYEQEDRIDSPVDIPEAARDLGVETGALFAVVDHFERRNDFSQFKTEEPLIDEIHAYNNAIAVVELTDPIGHNVDGEPYALVNFEGHVFPFHPTDLKYVEDLLDESEITWDHQEVTWLAFINDGEAVKGPFTDEETALEAIPEDHESFHLEPRYVNDEPTECVAENVIPTY